MEGGAWGGRPANDLGQDLGQDLGDELADGPTRPEAAARPGAGRMLFRFGLGLATLARARMNAVLAFSESAAGVPGPVAASDDPQAPRLADAALGVLLGLADIRLRLPPNLAAGWTKIAASSRRLATPLVRAASLVGWLPGVPRRAAELRAWRAREGRRIARWAAAGRGERAESRAVARAALTTMREAMLARISESPDLKRVIHEQSAGIAVTAMSELRERSAHIDDLAEGAVGRLLGRGRARRSR